MTDSPSTSDDWRKVFDWFDEWQQATPEQRDALLASVHARAPLLFPRLSSMIRAHLAAEERDFLRDSALRQVLSAPLAPLAGTSLGAWVLREVIGTGGMGQVWLATRGDQMYAGRAAVKLLHVANASPEANVRFAHEGEFLARIAHPCIAQLYDAGLTADGTRYLVLEYVEGKPLDEACDWRRLSVDARLRLFLQVCDAVAFAHQQHVVHRDLKPANILVTANGHVKLLDFGIAKLMGDAAEGSQLTKTGAQWFTLEYAAPEQIDQESATTATDVYSLGLVLYSLLCGTKPNAHVRTLKDALHYLEAPARPMRIAITDCDITAVAWQRSCTPSQLQAQLRGDLETIIAKALKVAPSERYHTAQALGDDLRRYLNNEPVHARPDSWSYRTRKLIRRNRVQALAAAAVTAALLLGLATTTWQWRSAVKEAERARSAINLFAAAFTVPDLGAPDESLVSLRSLLNRAWGQLRKEFAQEPDIKAQLARPLGLMLSTADEMAPAVEALEISRQYMAGTDAVHTRAYVTVLLQLGVAHYQLKNTAAAKQNFNAVIAIAPTLPERDLDEPIYARIELAAITRQEGPLSLGRQQLERAAQLARSTFDERHPTYVLAQQELGNLSFELCGGTPPLPPPKIEPSSSDDPQLRLIGEQYLAIQEVRDGRYDRAIARLRLLLPKLTTMFGATNQYTINGHLWMSVALFQAGQLREGETELQTAQTLAAESDNAPLQMAVELSLARRSLRTGHAADAEPWIRAQVLRLGSAGSGWRSSQASVQLLFGELLLRTQRVEEAERVLTRTYADQSAFAGQDHYLRDSYQTVLWRALAADAKAGAAQAIEHYALARDIGTQCLVPEHPDLLRLHLLHDYAAWRADDSSPARARLQTSWEMYQRAMRTRADSPGLSVLKGELTQARAPAQVLNQLLSLMNY